jgi:hypothetical protein
MTIPKECECEAGWTRSCPLHGHLSRESKWTTPVQRLVSIVVAALVFMTFFFFGRHAGYVAGYEEATSPDANMATCESENVLDGATWRIDLRPEGPPLIDQRCKQHDAFPDQILCERTVTIACDLPRR